MSYPREYYEFCEDSLSKVLNIDTNEIVLIPLDNPIVQDVAVIPEITTIGLPNLSNMSYRSITEHIDLPEFNKDDTKEFIINHIQNDYEPTYPLDLSQPSAPSGKSYELAYDQLIEKGFVLHEILAQLKTTVQGWQEAYIADALVMLGIDGSKKSHAERTEIATQAIKDSAEYDYHGIINLCRPARFNVDSEDQIVYSVPAA
ncbi:MAG: hypothetical protein ACPHVJ_06910 [Psychrobacter sp.]